jgi:hypothetical protein
LSSRNINVQWFSFSRTSENSVYSYERDQVPATASSDYLFLISILVQQTLPARIKLLPWELPNTTAIFQKGIIALHVAQVLWYKK